MRQQLAWVSAAILATAACSQGLDVPRTAKSTPGSFISSSISVPYPGESFDVVGSTGAAGATTVRLQQRQDGAWTDARRVTSSPSGRFVFDGMTVSTTTQYRAVARSKDVNTVIMTVPVAHKKPTARLTSLPAIAGVATRKAEGPSVSRSLLVGRFTPARPGRVVTFERRTRDGWGPALRARQDDKGEARVQVPNGDLRSRWRATAAAQDGLDASVTRTARPTPWSTTFSSDFSGSEMPTSWMHRYPDAWRPNRVCAITRTSNATFPSGIGRLTTNPIAKVPSTMRGTAPPRSAVRSMCRDATGEVQRYSGASMLSSTGDGITPYTFTYGVAAARVRFDRKPGQHGAFWLQTNESRGTEIDVIESFGEGASAPKSGIYYAKGRNLKASAHRVVGPDRPTAKDDGYSYYRTYAVIWTPEAYVFTIDGREVYRTTSGRKPQPHFVVLSNIVADWEIRRNSGEAAHMDVDWVRVWQQGTPR